MDTIFSALIPHVDNVKRHEISKTLEVFGASMLQFTVENGVLIRPLGKGEKYAAASPALQRLDIDVDGWNTPPAGLFVVEERTVYLRSHSSMTVAHEFGHAIDCALGGGAYLSTNNAEIRRAFLHAQRFVTPYAASRIDEYFAEAIRAFVECNDVKSPWPNVTRARLRRIDPVMHDIVERIFRRFAAL